MRVLVPFLLTFSSNAFVIVPNKLPACSPLKALDPAAIDSISSVDVSSSIDQSKAIIIGGAVAVLSLGTAIATFIGGPGNNRSENVMEEIPEEEPEPEPVDVSIPYDAAIQLAYDSWKDDHGATSYETFKAAYVKKAVAEVIAKKAAKDLENMA